MLLKNVFKSIWIKMKPHQRTEEFDIKYMAGSGNMSVFFYEDEKREVLWIPLDAVF